MTPKQKHPELSDYGVDKRKGFYERIHTYCGFMMLPIDGVANPYDPYLSRMEEDYYFTVKNHTA